MGTCAAVCGNPEELDPTPRLIIATTVHMPPDGVDKYMEDMKKIVLQSRASPGVVRYDLLRERKNPTKFLHYLCLSSEVAWQRFQASTNFKQREALSNGSTSTQVVLTTIGLPDWAWQFEYQKTGQGETGFAVFVTVEVKADRLADFMTTIKADAFGIRDRSVDPGGVRMDLLKSTHADNTFVFYECYDDEKAMGLHRETAHFAGWQEFKKSGGIVNQTVAVLDSTSIPGDWAFQG